MPVDDQVDSRTMVQIGTWMCGLRGAGGVTQRQMPTGTPVVWAWRPPCADRTRLCLVDTIWSAVRDRPPSPRDSLWRGLVTLLSSLSMEDLDPCQRLL